MSGERPRGKIDGRPGDVPPRWQRIGRRIAIGLVGLALAVPPIVSAISPAVAVVMAGREVRASWSNTERDASGLAVVVTRTNGRGPWGHRLHARHPSGVGGPSPSRTAWYSIGPNGRDEAGGGDDLVPTDRERAIGVRLGPARGTLIWLAILIGFMTTEVAWAGRARRLPKEALRAGTLAMLILPALLGVAVVVGGPDIVMEIGQLPGLYVPTVVAFLGGLMLLSLALAVAWRVRRPTSEAPTRPV